MCEVTKAYRLRTHKAHDRQKNLQSRLGGGGEHMAYLKDSMPAPEL